MKVQGCIKPAWERRHPAGGFRFHAPAGCQGSQPQLSGLQFMSLMQP